MKGKGGRLLFIIWNKIRRRKRGNFGRRKKERSAFFRETGELASSP